MFFDLNVPVLRSSVDRDRTALLAQLFEYGYDCVALNTVIYGRLPKQHRCAVERIHFDPSSVVGRSKIRDPSLLRRKAGVGSGGGGAMPPGQGATAECGPDQVTRLTVVLENPADAQVLTAGSDALQTYDIVAAVPCCQRSFELLCRESDVDVILLPSGKRLPFAVNKKHTDAALARGAVFEVTYSQAIQSSAARRYLIGNTRALVGVTRGRGIILTSGAETWLTARNPHDVANLGQLLGLTQEQSLRAVSDTPLALLRRAEARKNRFKGLTINKADGEGETAGLSLLESLQVPKKFYLPKAVALERQDSPASKATPGVDMIGQGDRGTATKNDQEEAEEENAAGFLSFGTGAMEVDS